MNHIDNLAPEEIAAFRSLIGKLVSADEARLLMSNPSIIAAALFAARTTPEYGFAPGLFTPLEDKMAMVEAWPGYTRADVKAAFEEACDNGTIDGYEAEVRSSRLLDLVFIPCQESVSATMRYLLDRLNVVWGSLCPHWSDAYGEGVDDERVKLIPGARPFTPDKLVLVAVDFGANLKPYDDSGCLGDLQSSQAQGLEGLGVLANAIQSPNWVMRQVEGGCVPSVIAGGLTLNMPSFEPWAYSPVVSRGRESLCLSGHKVSYPTLRAMAVPVRREYPRQSHDSWIHRVVERWAARS